MSKAAGRSRAPATPRPDNTDDNIGLDAQDDDWAWRRRLRANPTTARLYRGAVALLGLVIVVAGLIAVPAPGPGWLIVFVGVSVWASEFEWAQRLLGWGRARLHEWNAWMMRQHLWVKALVAVATLALILAVFWGYVAWQGSPQWLPDQIESVLELLPGVPAR